MSVRRSRVFAALLFVAVALPRTAHAQAAAPAPPIARTWHFMQDAILFAEYNHQGGPRGGDELVAPNWWMGMASRATARGRLTFTTMVSLDALTVGRAGYRELFQAGEALDGRPLVDRQHPHDLFMQLAAVWRMPLGHSAGLTLAGGPVGEPALGPVAFMHRASAADNPTAPLGHHTFDSTHIAFGVVTAAVDRGPWTIEGSIFNGREPDDDRWNLEVGRLDSFSGRVWYKPTREWELQASSGRLADPEALEPGNLVRSTVSVSWMRQSGGDVAAVTAAAGHNRTDRGGRTAVFVEGSRHTGLNTVYGRVETLQPDAAILASAGASPAAIAGAIDSIVTATAGGVRNFLSWRGFEGGIGADVTLYRVPDALQAAYTRRPTAVHVFFRLRAPAAMGRMWNMRMSRPMTEEHTDMPMHHQHPM